MKPEYLVSACLLGFACRYDGASKPCGLLVQLYRDGKAVPICPESLSGLPVPRLPCEQTKAGILCRDGRNLTAEFELGASRALRKALALGLRKAILKARSPSCGVGTIYDGSFTGKLCQGNGVFAQKLLDNGWDVEDEDNWLQKIMGYDSCSLSSLARTAFIT